MPRTSWAHARGCGRASRASSGERRRRSRGRRARARRSPSPGSSVTASSALESSTAFQGPRAAARSAAMTLEGAAIERVEPVEQVGRVAAGAQRLPDHVPAVVLDEQGAVVARTQVSGVEPGERVGEVRGADLVRTRVEPRRRGGRAGRPPPRRASAGSRARRRTRRMHARRRAAGTARRRRGRRRRSRLRTARAPPTGPDETGRGCGGSRGGCSSSSRRGSGSRPRRRARPCAPGGGSGSRRTPRAGRPPSGLRAARASRARRRGERAAPRPGRDRCRALASSVSSVAIVSTALFGSEIDIPAARAVSSSASTSSHVSGGATPSRSSRSGR